MGKLLIYECDNNRGGRSKKLGNLLPSSSQKHDYKFVNIYPKKGHHLCKYCGQVAEGSNTDLLCNDCHELFGHTLYSEL
jgi:hypothetical protein